MKKIGAELSKSIKEQCWVYLDYLNQQDETTHFWAAIKDVLPKEKKIVVAMFNPSYYDGDHTHIIEATLFFDGIKRVVILEETT